MRASDEAMGKLVDALAAEIGHSASFELELGELIGKYRRRRRKEVALMAAEDTAFELLRRGEADNLAERQGCHRVTVYRRAARARKRSCIAPLADATTG